jgi:hypothetical protein
MTGKIMKTQVVYRLEVGEGVFLGAPSFSSPQVEDEVVRLALKGDKTMK